MLVLLFGEEDFLIKKRLEEIKEGFLKEEAGAPLFSFDLSEEEEIDWERILNQSGGLFSEKKIVILKNINLCSKNTQEKIKNTIKKQKADKEKNLWIVGSYVTRKKDKKNSFKDQKTTQEKKSKREKNILVEFFRKNCQKKEEFNQFSQKEAVNFVRKQINKKSDGKVSVSNKTAYFLAENWGNNLWFLDQLLEKLVCFKEEGVIEQQDIEKFTTANSEFEIFDFLSAVAKRDKAKAILIIQNFWEKKVNEFYLLVMIFYQLRNLIKVKQLFEKGFTTERQISLKLKMHPFVARKTLQQINFFSKKELKELFYLAAKIDEEVKVGKYDIKEGLDLFIFSL